MNLLLRSACLANATNGRKIQRLKTTQEKKTKKQKHFHFNSIRISKAVGKVVFMLIKQSREQIILAFIFVVFVSSIGANIDGAYVYWEMSEHLF